MLKRMAFAYAAITGAFHNYISPIFTFFGFFLLHTIVSIGMAADHLFFPSLRKRKIEKPIIIVGNPRSGTTFLHRFLVENDFGAGSRLWKMIIPSLTLQILLKPFLPVLEKISPARHHTHAAHKTSLTGFETDDPSILFRYFDGFFVYGFILAWSDKNLRGLFDPDIRDTARRDFIWLKKMWKRHLISERRDRIVGKLFSLGVRVPRFLEIFPDARILYMVRDPLQTVPSGMSLITGVLDRKFGFWSLPEEKRRRYLDRLYEALLELSIRFHRDYVEGKMPSANVKIVTYDRLMKNFDGLMDEIIAFTGTESTPCLKARIEETAKKQRQYRSRHQYDLKRFGLNREKILRDYAPVYDTFINVKSYRSTTN